MLRNESARDDGVADSREETDAARSDRRFVLGLLVAAIVAGYVGFTDLTGGALPDLGLLVPVLGGVLTSTLLGEALTSRRLARPRWLVVPSIELVTAYALLGVLFVAVSGGYLTVGIASGLLLVCSFGAVVATAPRIREALTDGLDDEAPE